MVDLSDNGRRQRARDLVVQGKVVWVREDDGIIHAGVAGSDANVEYPVSITLKEREDGSFRARGHLCTCYDHGRAGACKHVLAAVGEWFLEKRREWFRLRDAENILAGALPAAQLEAA